MLAFSINYYGLSFRATQSVELFCAYDGKVSKLLDFTERKGEDIADPWYTGDFDTTYRDVKEGCEALLNDCLLRL